MKMPPELKNNNNNNNNNYVIIIINRASMKLHMKF